MKMVALLLLLSLLLGGAASLRTFVQECRVTVAFAAAFEKPRVQHDPPFGRVGRAREGPRTPADHDRAVEQIAKRRIEFGRARQPVRQSPALGDLAHRADSPKSVCQSFSGQWR